MTHLKLLSRRIQPLLLHQYVNLQPVEGSLMFLFLTHKLLLHGRHFGPQLLLVSLKLLQIRKPPVYIKINHSGWMEVMLS